MTTFLTPGTPPAPRFQRGWQSESGPAAVVGEPIVLGEPEFGSQMPRWADHAYRYERDGEEVWVAEPYLETAFGWRAQFRRDKAKLEAAGYRVRADQAEGRYDPGLTVPIVITKERLA